MAQSVEESGVGAIGHTKVCRECACALPLSAFNRASANRDGLNNSCKQCGAAYKKRWRAANAEQERAKRAERYANERDAILAKQRDRYRVDPAKKLATNKAWQLANLDAMRKYSREHKRRNQEKSNAASAAWRAANRDQHRAAVAAWRAENKHVGAAATAARRAVKRASIALWADSEFERFAIAEAYHLASLRTDSTGVEHHVDHIVPLRGRTVCGLHCIANLRVIPALENMSKGARSWPGMPA